MEFTQNSLSYDYGRKLVGGVEFNADNSYIDPHQFITSTKPTKAFCL